MSTYEISQSSLLSLKAEILRKQEELSKAKLLNEVKLDNIKKNPPLFRKKNKDSHPEQEREPSPEAENLLKKSRSMLEAKAKLYDKLLQNASKTSDIPEENKRFLVQFEKKTKIPNQVFEGTREIDSSEEEDCIRDQNFPINSDEEWVEYTDCLGRTRTCMKKDLPHLKQDDEKLKREVDVRKGNTVIDGEPDNLTKKNYETSEENTEKSSENSELLSADMRREILRQQWEKQEEILRNKKDVHYQDILFDEARVHGVGYYGFSHDEEERAKQQEALKKLREETRENQQKTQEMKNLREKQMAARLKAARNRKRARMGLPPEEDEPEPEPQLQSTQETDEKDEITESKTDEHELARQEARSRHIRPWDIGKEGIKTFYEYTQEEWVDKKRAERPNEFAPPSSYRTEFRSVKPHEADIPCFENKSLKFTSKQPKHRESPVCSINPYRNSQYKDIPQPKHTDPQLIINECYDFDSEQDHFPGNEASVGSRLSDTCSLNGKRNTRGKGVEIAPPPMFDYYGPNESKRKKVDASGISLEDSIEAGLQYLRKEFEKKEKSTKHPDEMFLM